MTPPFPMPVPGQRAAEEFDSVISGRASVGIAPDRVQSYADLVATVQVLRDQPAVMPRAEFVVDLRERLMLAAHAEMVPTAPVVRRLPNRPQRRRRLATAAAALVMVGGTAGMAAAADGAQPGEALYPIKRGIEQVTIAAHVGDASKGAALLGQANDRLEEIRALVADGRGGSDLLDATVRDFDSSAGAGADRLFAAYQADGDTADVAKVREFAAAAMQQLDGMSVGADPATASDLRDAADALIDIDQQAAVLCADCGSGALTPPAALSESAAALAVRSLIARPSDQAGADLAREAAARDAREQADRAGLADAAQGQADKLGTTAGGVAGAGAGVTSTLTGTVNAAGELVPTVAKSGGGAVKGLVGGITGSLTGTGGGGGSGVSSTVKGAGNAVDETVDGVTDTVDELKKGLLDGDK